MSMNTNRYDDVGNFQILSAINGCKDVKSVRNAIKERLTKIDQEYRSAKSGFERMYFDVHDQQKMKGHQNQILNARSVQKISKDSANKLNDLLNKATQLALERHFLEKISTQIEEREVLSESSNKKFSRLGKDKKRSLKGANKEISLDEANGKIQKELEKIKNKASETKDRILQETSNKFNKFLESRSLQISSSDLSQRNRSQIRHVDNETNPKSGNTSKENDFNVANAHSQTNLSRIAPQDNPINQDESNDENYYSGLLNEQSDEALLKLSSALSIEQDNFASTGEVDDDPDFFLDNLSDNSDFDELSSEQIRAFAELRHQKESERSHFPKNTVFDSDISDSDDLLNDPTLTPWERRAMTPLSERVKNKQQANDPASRKSTKTDSLDDF